MPETPTPPPKPKTGPQKAIAALLASAMTAAAAFGLDVSPEMQNTIMVVGSAVTTVLVYLIRNSNT